MEEDKVTNQPLVSVIIAFLNEERFLVDAVESVLRQSYRNWELLLVDDGSTDKSVGMAKDYANRFPERIHYLQHEGHANKGLSASRNKGIQHARGSLIALLDADDVWLPEKLEQQTTIFKRHPEVAMVAEASLYWFSWEAVQKQDILIPVGAPPDKVYQATELPRYLYPLGTGAAPCPSGLMLTKKALEKAGGFEESFTKEYQLYEDQALLHKIYLKENVYISSACNNKYRQRTGSIVEKVHADGHYLAVRKYFLDWLEAYMQNEAVESKEVQHLLQKALLPLRHPQVYYLTNTVPVKVKRVIRKGINSLTKRLWQV